MANSSKRHEFPDGNDTQMSGSLNQTSSSNQVLDNEK